MNHNTYVLEHSKFGESYCIQDTDTDFFDVMNVELQNLHDSSLFDNFDWFLYLYLYLLYLYPGFYSYTDGATWKILDLLTETLLIDNSINEILCESKFEHDVNILNNDDLSSVCVPLEFSADINAFSRQTIS